ncbi:hypothetical protein M0802_014615, partial [Mischocyttarus mexicanus]
TLDEWKLVFYGTETSLESNEDLDKDKSTLTNVQQEEIHDNTATDARQNVVDTEGDPWTGSQQVERVSHPEVQKPTTENQTSGCTNLDGGNGRCLATVANRSSSNSIGSCCNSSSSNRATFLPISFLFCCILFYSTGDAAGTGAGASAGASSTMLDSHCCRTFREHETNNSFGWRSSGRNETENREKRVARCCCYCFAYEMTQFSIRR